MKQLQNNFTDVGQSKRLLELGVPEDSADCCFILDGRDEIIERLCVEFRLQELEKENYIFEDFYNLPCWSVGRLIEIWEICGNGGRCVTVKKGQSRIESLVKLYEENALYADFSKLEDKL